jgi:flagellar motor switch protein FliM
MDEVLSQEEIDALLNTMGGEAGPLAPGEPPSGGTAPAATPSGLMLEPFPELEAPAGELSGILSGPEVDALLSTIADAQGGAEAGLPGPQRKGVKRYDFRRPHKFSKEQLRLLHRLNENFARALSSSLSAYLRLTVQIRLISVDQMIYDEFIHSVPGLTILIVFSIEPPGLRAMLEVSPSVIFPMLDRLLGGTGNTPPMSRDLTDIERALMEGIITRSLSALREAWNNARNLELRTETVETNPQFAQVVSPHTPIALATFEVKIRDAVGMMSLCLPDVAFESLVAVMNEHEAQLSTLRTYDTKAAYLRLNLTEVSLPLIAQLGCARITTEEVLDLQVGDVIRLDHAVEGELAVLIGQQPKFQARPGLSRRHLAVQITRVLEPLLPAETEDAAEEEEPEVAPPVMRLA